MSKSLFVILKEGREIHKRLKGTSQELKPVSKAQETTAPFVYFEGNVLLEKKKSWCSVTCPDLTDGAS